MRRIASGGPWEERVGYCRAVIHNGIVHVAGTCARPDAAADVVSQCRSALHVIGEALAEARTGFEHAIRVRYILPEMSEFEACWPLLRDTFGANRPAATVFQAALIDPRYRIEIELDAALPQDMSR
jgi:enamine deaminase RidA (YjgF/YER057c/UK114 family)